MTSVALVAFVSAGAVDAIAPIAPVMAVFAWGSRLPVESWTAVAATIQAVFAVLAGGTSLAWCSSVSFVTDMAFFAGRARVTWGANVALRTGMAHRALRARSSFELGNVINGLVRMSK